MPLKKIKIATRASPLALWQAKHVKVQILKYHPALEIELVRIRTQGDRMLDTPLSLIGGKGLFIKELELALYEKRADIAVHSMKDVTIDMPDGLILPVILERDNPSDVLITHQIDHIDKLPQGAIVGTSSLRRKCQLQALRADINIKELRGNVGTRLQKLKNGEYDAIILAAAGLIRLGLQHHINAFIDTDSMLPAIGQGAIGIQIRKNDDEILQTIHPLNDISTQQQVETERIISKRLFGDCKLPIAAHAQVHDHDQHGKQIYLRGMVGRVDGSEIIRHSVSGSLQQCNALGLELAEHLLKQGADKILQEIIKSH